MCVDVCCLKPLLCGFCQSTIKKLIQHIFPAFPFFLKYQESNLGLCIARHESVPTIDLPSSFIEERDELDEILDSVRYTKG